MNKEYQKLLCKNNIMPIPTWSNHFVKKYIKTSMTLWLDYGCVNDKLPEKKTNMSLNYAAWPLITIVFDNHHSKLSKYLVILTVSKRQQ